MAAHTSAQLVVLGAASGQPSARGPWESVTFLHLAFSQTQNHFLFKSHNSPQRGEQQACAAAFVLAERGRPSIPPLSKERGKAKNNEAGIKGQILFHKHRDGACAMGQGSGRRLGLRWERVWSLQSPRTPIHVLPQVRARLGAEMMGAPRGFLEEATPKLTLQGGREEGRKKKIQAEETACANGMEGSQSPGWGSHVGRCYSDQRRGAEAPALQSRRRA